MNIEKPFPLRRLFFRRVVPGIVVTVIVLTGMALYGMNSLVRNLYLEQARRRAEVIFDTLKAKEPQAWDELMITQQPRELFKSEHGKRLFDAITSVILEKHTTDFKLYSPNRKIIYSPQTVAIGGYEDKPALDDVFRKAIPHIIYKPDLKKNELYIPILDSRGDMLVVFELYDEQVVLNELLIDNFAQPLAVPAILFLLLTIYMFALVNKSQKDINERSRIMTMMHDRLKPYVSRGTVDLALDLSNMDDIPPERIATTIFASDVRDFTSFADNHPPTETVNFLNQIMSVQIGIIQKYNGDVDKLIGDAVLAKFDGADSEGRALEASKEILEKLATMDLKREIGIGVLAGDVLTCAIGSADRKDFTIIGDSVNLAARLCSAAGATEIVVDDRTLRLSGHDVGQFGDIESIKVKGHEAPIKVRRCKIKVAKKKPPPR